MFYLIDWLKSFSDHDMLLVCFAAAVAYLVFTGFEVGMKGLGFLLEKLFGN